jgi:aminoglycoside phosphotransferase (APT) family kinase protein
MLLAGRVDPGHIRQFAALLASIHRRSAERDVELAPIFDDRTFFESLRIEPYYQYTATQVTQAARFLHDLIAATRVRRHCLVHGDYSPKNILVHYDKLILLDHEVIHWGDPAFDLGFALTHLLSKAHHLLAHRSAFAEAATLFWSTYRADLGTPDWANDLEVHAVRHTLGCLLARVAGRSPLEYLSSEERSRQRATVV